MALAVVQKTEVGLPGDLLAALGQPGEPPRGHIGGRPGRTGPAPGASRSAERRVARRSARCQRSSSRIAGGMSWSAAPAAAPDVACRRGRRRATARAAMAPRPVPGRPGPPPAGGRRGCRCRPWTHSAAAGARSWRCRTSSGSGRGGAPAWPAWPAWPPGAPAARRADPAEPARAGGAQQVQADVGGRGAVRHHVVRRGLQVVGRQVVVVAVTQRSKKRQVSRAMPSGRRWSAAGSARLGTRRRGRLTQPIHSGEARPQQAQRQRPGRVRRAGREQRRRRQRRQQRLGRRCRRSSARSRAAAACAAAAVVHCSRWRWLTTMRYSARTIASTASSACCSSSARCHSPPPARAASRRRPGGRSAAWRRRRGWARSRPPRPSAARRQRPPAPAPARPTATAHAPASASSSSASDTGATSERRRLSSIFQRLSARSGQRRGLQQEGQQLPVAARPAVHARGGHVGMEGRVLDQRDVADRRAARERAFEQVVAEHPAFGQPAAQHRVHRAHVEQALAGEGAFAEQVLVDLGAGRAVGVDAALAGEQPVEAACARRRRQRRHHARLQDAVAAEHAAAGGVQPGWLCGCAATPTSSRRRPGGSWVSLSSVTRSACRGATCEASPRSRKAPRSPVPARPRPAARACRACAPSRSSAARCAERGARGAAAGSAARAPPPAGCGCSARGCPGAARSAARRRRPCCAAVGIGPVGQQRELRLRLGVGQVVQLQPVHQRVDRWRRRSASPASTTITRCAAGMPCASASRGRCRGRADSLISRLITATTASDAGNSISARPAAQAHGAGPRGATASRPPGRACGAASAPR